MINPFTIKVISSKDSFCNRLAEQDDLMAYAKSDTNIVLYSPRRYGKTSLIRQVQKRLSNDSDVLTGYADFFGLSSVDDLAGRIAKSVYVMLAHKKNSLQKAIQAIKTFRPVMRPTETGVDFSIEPAIHSLAGMDLLEKTMDELSGFINTTDYKINMVFDEFQEITELKNPAIEGCLRKHIQEQRASYFFVGSRRRLLLDMFNQRNRPFYQSAINYELKKLPREEFHTFIKSAFERSGKACSNEIVTALLEQTSDHPYYSQKLALFVFNVSGDVIQITDIQKAFSLLLNTETVAFESLLLGVAPQQIALLKAIAREPAKKILTNHYMHIHGLKSIGGVQAATKRLSQLDLIEKDDEKTWHVVDPIFSQWLNSQG